MFYKYFMYAFILLKQIILFIYFVVNWNAPDREVVLHLYNVFTLCHPDIFHFLWALIKI